MKALGIVIIVLGVLALGVFGLVQFRTISIHEQAIAENTARFEKDGDIVYAKIVDEARGDLATARKVRNGSGAGAAFLLLGGVLLTRRGRRT